MAPNIIVDSWKANNLPTKILRAWLGVTWFYAGWQKASDAGFLSKASATYLGAQLAGFAKHSPVGWILARLVHFAQPLGWFVLLAELAIGIAVLTGAYIQLAAIGGALVSLGLWLSVTWTANPYFLGSDSAYLVMWIVLLFAIRAQQKKSSSDGLVPNLTDRRNVLQLIGVGAASILSAIAGGFFKKSVPVKSAGKEIVKLSDFPVGSTMQYTASDGNPAFLFRTNVGVFAYSAVCTHQGCVVSYTSQTKTLDCPCHGGQFDPFNGGNVVAGPPPSALPTYKVSISGNSIVAG